MTNLLLMAAAGAAAAWSGMGRAEIASPVAPAGAPAQFGSLAHPLSAVFAPGTTPEQMTAAYQRLLARYGILGLEHMIGGAGLELQPSGSRWNTTRGTPVNLTYSFPPDGTNTGQGGNTINSTLTSKIGDPLWKTRIAQALAEWEDVTANIYTLVSDDGASWPNNPGSVTRGDLRIVAAPEDGPSNVLAFNFFPPTGDMLIDNAENWGASANNHRFFRNVITHENGHGMGLFHVCPVEQTKIMEPFLSTAFDGAQFDDVLAMQYQYGDAAEPNPTLSTGEPLGLVSDANLTVNNMSLHATNDFDVYTFEAMGGSTLNLARAIPFGTPFLNGPQNQNGSCSAGFLYDPLRQIDLQIEVLSPTGAVIASANATGLGGTEEVTSVALSTDGTYGVRVRTGGATSSDQFIIQPYALVVNVTIQSIAGDLSGDGRINALDITLILNAFGSTNSALDLNGDGVVNAGDITIILNNWTG